jgi:hypothetical protein
LDGGKAVLQGVHVMAMVVGADGTLYAGGRDTHDPRTPNQPNPIGLGSVFLFSHDHGAHWIKRVSEEPPPGYVAHYPPWTDHTRWPSNFTVYQLVVDPHHPATIYAAGGLPVSTGSRGRPHLLLRSTNGGRTWDEILVHNVTLTTTPQLVTNIVVTPANRQDLTYRHAYNAQAIAIDPRDPRRLYVGTDALGVLRSTDGGTTWQYYAASPSVTVHTAEHLVIDAHHSATLYALIQDTTVAYLYRSDNSGVNWSLVWHGGFASTVAVEGGTLYLVRGDGIYASTDRGAHWHLAVNPRTLAGFTSRSATVTGIAGSVLQALHDRQAGDWEIVTDIDVAASPFGLFESSNSGATWTLLTHGQRVPGGSLALAIGDMDEGYTRLWLDEDTNPRILFTSSDLDGLFRWGIAP